MTNRYFITLFFLIQSLWLFSQVGINNSSPEATLDVVGDVLVQEKLYLENPGTYASGPTSRLLMYNTGTGVISKYNVTGSTFGPLNYVRFAFLNTSNYGLDQGYNTKIDASKYTVAVHGYSYRTTGSTSVVLRSASSNTYIEGHQFYAYISGGTWWLKALVNNSQFYVSGNLARINIYMDLIVYRNNFITKIWDTPLIIDMGKNDNATAPLPTGF